MAQGGRRDRATGCDQGGSAGNRLRPAWPGRRRVRSEIRLFGIDSPEWDQPHGEQARDALAGLVSRQQVGLVTVETDGFGRTVATVYMDGRNINLTMVENGHAWWYRRYAPYERHLAEAEQQARQRARGLWSNPDPRPPWEWRRRH